MIALIDYYAGNIRSIENAFKKLGTTITLTRKPEDLRNADAIILPGVGNFGDAMRELGGYKSILWDEVSSGKPFLGLCLGIQVILKDSEESPGVAGLGLVEGGCRRFPDALKVPHMGWNNIRPLKKIPLLEGVRPEDLFYFVHSYYPQPEDKTVVAGVTQYGVEFPSVIAKDNLMATQFHPEKSGEPGLRVLKNFLKFVRK